MFQVSMDEETRQAFNSHIYVLGLRGSKYTALLLATLATLFLFDVLFFQFFVGEALRPYGGSLLGSLFFLWGYYFLLAYKVPRERSVIGQIAILGFSFVALFSLLGGYFLSIAMGSPAISLYLCFLFGSLIFGYYTFSEFLLLYFVAGTLFSLVTLCSSLSIYQEGVYLFVGLKMTFFVVFVAGVLYTRFRRDFLEKHEMHKLVLEKTKMEKEARRLLKESIKAEQGLTKLKEEAEEAAIQKALFISNMSHEIRTPLNAIIGFGQILKKDSSFSPKQKEYVGVILESGECLLAIINDILQLSKMEAGRANLLPHAFSLPDFLDELQALFALRLRDTPLTLHLDQEALPLYIGTDEEKLRQILLNLLSHGVEQKLAGRLFLRVWTEPSQGEGVQLHIKGTLEEDKQTEQLSHLIKESFLQDEAGKRPGLHAALIRSLIRVIGGRLLLGDSLEAGELFHLYVEVALCDSASEKKETTPLGQVAPSGAFRFMCVKNHGTPGFWKEILASKGILVMEVEREKVGPEVRKRQPHGFLVDFREDKEEAYGLVAKVREFDRRESILLLGVLGVIGDVDQESLWSTGTDVFLEPPLSAETLFAEWKKASNIRYVVAKESRVERKTTLNEELWGLTKEERQAMHHAVSQGSMVMLRRLIEDSSLEEETREQLMNLANAYDYDTLFMLFAKDEGREKGAVSLGVSKESSREQREQGSL